MNPPYDRPTIAEVAALTRRLRELSAQGRAADPAERAAFLAEKDALLARIVDADSSLDRELHRHGAQLNRTDGPDDVAFDADDSQWWHPGGSARLDLPHPDVLPPQAQPAHVVDPAELAARAAALRDQIGVDDADPRTVWECERPVGPVPWCTVVDGSELEARRDQLARWHDDAPAVEQDTESRGFMDPPYGDSGWSR
ncbi:hypothetical protein [Pseudonocardia sp.]|uniref:hypothetical protein n=1 Tax=Pseudonocardia sp. TaxID=60912 RepID=UPI0026268C70|nr:hypothetical protein [Pseudonocardia sp.]